jgi:uncharacterized protein
VILKFDLSPLIGARPGERLVFSLDEGPQELEDIYTEFLRGALQFTRVRKGILVEGQVETRVQVECVRCLEPFFVDQTLEIEETIGLVGQQDPEIKYRVDEEGWFEVAPLLREQAWVALPMKPVCRPDCRGFCAQCGTNLNLEECDCSQERINPQFAALASLLDEDQE